MQNQMKTCTLLLCAVLSTLSGFSQEPAPEDIASPALLSPPSFPGGGSPVHRQYA